MIKASFACASAPPTIPFFLKFVIGPSNIDIGYWTYYIGLYWMILDDIGLIGLIEQLSNIMSNKSNIDI